MKINFIVVWVWVCILMSCLEGKNPLGCKMELQRLWNSTFDTPEVNLPSSTKIKCLSEFHRSRRWLFLAQVWKFSTKNCTAQDMPDPIFELKIKYIEWNAFYPVDFFRWCHWSIVTCVRAHTHTHIYIIHIVFIAEKSLEK